MLGCGSFEAVRRYASRSRLSRSDWGVWVLSNETYEVRSRDVVAEDFDGEFVVLDLLNGKYYSLAGGAAVLWRALLAGHSLHSLGAGLPAGDSRCADAAETVAALVANGLLVPRSEPAPPAPAEFVAEFVRTQGPYVIDAFDDLAELLVADPVHDVDPEAGWPHRPPKD